MKKLAALLIFFPALAYAAEPEKTFTLTLSTSEVITIGKLLGQQPYNDVNVLIGKIQQQVNEQNKPAETPVKPEVK